LGGEEILMVLYPDLDKEIINVIKSVPNLGINKINKEKTKN
jgi:hypothetical protein